MTIFSLFEKLTLEQPELFLEAANNYGFEDSLTLTTPYAAGAVAKNDELFLFGNQLGKIDSLLRQTDEFKNAEKIYYVDGPTFVTDAEGVLLKNSRTYLGEGAITVAKHTTTYQSDETLPYEFFGDVYLYCIRISGADMPVDMQRMKPGAVMQRLPFSDDRVIIIKYSPSSITKLTGLSGAELVDRISENVGNNIAKLIADDVPTVEKKKVVTYRAAVNNYPVDIASKLSATNEVA
jgi:hypothetical protein